MVNPRTLELETTKEMLSELFDIMTYEVDEMIRRGWKSERFTVRSSVYCCLDYLPSRPIWDPLCLLSKRLSISRTLSCNYMKIHHV